MEVWPTSGGGITTAADVDASFLSGSVDTFTRNVCARANEVAYANDGARRKRDSRDGCSGNSVPGAERNIAK